MKKNTVVLSTEIMAQPAYHQYDQRKGDDDLGSEPVVHLATEQEAKRPCDRQDDAESADLDGSPAELTSRIYPAKGKQGDQAVLEDHVCEKKQEDVAVLSSVPKAVPQIT
jgi:hypothetical protein